MQMVLVMRQLSGLLDAYLLRVTRRVRLTPQEALVLAWMEERPGISAAAIAECLGRYRQSVQRSLEGLEDRMLVERYASLGMDLAGGSAGDFDALLRNERDKWAKVVKLSGAKIE